MNGFHITEANTTNLRIKSNRTNAWAACNADNCMDEIYVRPIRLEMLSFKLIGKSGDFW